MIGSEALENALEEVFSNIPLPDRIKSKRKRGIKGNGRRGKDKGKEPVKAPKNEPVFSIDPLLIEYLKEKRDYLAGNAFRFAGAKSPKEITDIIELKEVFPERILKEAARRGWKIGAQPAIDFVKKHRRTIEKINKDEVRILKREKPEVNDKVNDYFDRLRESQGDENVLEFLSDPANARDGYAFFDKNRPKGGSVSDMLLVLKSTANDFVTKFEADVRKRKEFDQSLRSWWRLAKSLEYTNGDKRLATVKVLFEEAKDREFDKESSVTDRVYEGMRQFTKALVDKSCRYEVEELRFVMDGLWFDGYFTKKDKKNKGTRDEESVDAEDEEFIDAEEGEFVDRKRKGVDTQFVWPVRHLMRRYEIYNRELDAAFSRLLSKGDISEGLKLESRTDDLKLGVKIYFEVPERIRNVMFTHLQTGVPLKEPDIGRKEYSSESDKSKKPSSPILNFILPLYVGARREELLQKVIEHYEN